MLARTLLPPTRGGALFRSLAPPGATLVSLAAPAKVNLFLEVLGRRPDGYHALETLMLPVNLFDTLTFRHRIDGELRLTCSSPTLDAGPDNLVLRAARLLREATGVALGADIRLDKRIPLGGGLAGGSSDAAAALVGLDRLWQLGLGRDRLDPLAARLGSDVNFFLGDGPAWCTGRGEVVRPVECASPLSLVLVLPDFGLPTPAVFRELAAGVPHTPVAGDAIRAALAQGDIDAIGRSAHNRLEDPANRLDARVGRWLGVLHGVGSLGARMSGSGSSLFAVCRDGAHAARVASAVSAGATAAGLVGLVFVVHTRV